MAPKATQRRFRVNVTAEDIAKAKQNDSTRCVVAQAIARTIPDATRIEVDTQTIRFTRVETGERFNYLSPPEVSGYVIGFDAGDELGAFSFTITNPIRVARMKKTEVGRAADKARAAAKRQEPVASTTELATTADSVTMPMSDEEKAAAGKAAYQAAKEDATGEPLTRSDGGVRPRRRIYKTGKRVYGSRILRINRYLQEESANA